MAFSSVKLEGKYEFGQPRIPPWVGDVMSNMKYDIEGKLIGADVLTSIGVKYVKQGDVLMRINGSIALLNKMDAKKYGVTR